MALDDQPNLGSWFLRIDRFGDTHAVAAQNKGQSCALASIKMIVFKINKLRPGAGAFVKEKEIETIYLQQAGEASHDFDTNGSQRGIQEKVLNQLGIGTWKWEQPAPTNIPQLLIDGVGEEVLGLGPFANTIRHKYPAIIGCSWNGGGGHALCVDTITTVPGIGTYAAICDPWDGEVHIQRIEVGAPITYIPKHAIGINFWGDTKDDADRKKYAAANQPMPAPPTGTITGIIYRV